MKLIKEIYESDVGGEINNTVKLTLRRAVRVFLSRKQDGKIALLYNGLGEYHKLPGGGIEVSEDISDAIVREIYEEVGCKCKVEGELGVVNEFRQEFNQVQINYCYIV